MPYLVNILKFLFQHAINIRIINQMFTFYLSYQGSKIQCELYTSLTAHLSLDAKFS
jgi:uncharacterized membrane protein